MCMYMFVLSTSMYVHVYPSNMLCLGGQPMWFKRLCALWHQPWHGCVHLDFARLIGPDGKWKVIVMLYRRVCTMYIYIYIFMNMYVHATYHYESSCTYTCSWIHKHVHTCLYHVQTRIYSFAISCPGCQDSRCCLATLAWATLKGNHGGVPPWLMPTVLQMIPLAQAGGTGVHWTNWIREAQSLRGKSVV